MALMRGLHASFMRQNRSMVSAEAGCIPTHRSRKDGKNAFYDPDAPRQLSETCMHFIGGLLKHAKAITRVANPTINSYKRLSRVRGTLLHQLERR